MPAISSLSKLILILFASVLIATAINVPFDMFNRTVRMVPMWILGLFQVGVLGASAFLLFNSLNVATGFLKQVAGFALVIIWTTIALHTFPNIDQEAAIWIAIIALLAVPVLVARNSFQETYGPRRPHENTPDCEKTPSR